VVITSELGSTTSLAHPANSSQASQDVGTGMATYWRQLQEHGIGVIAIRETPQLRVNGPACVSQYGAAAPACSVSRSQGDPSGQPISYAERALSGTVPVIDMNSLICGPATCPAVVGNVLVYFDNRHMTQSYAQTLAPYLRVKLTGALAKALPSALGRDLAGAAGGGGV